MRKKKYYILAAVFIGLGMLVILDCINYFVSGGAYGSLVTKFFGLWVVIVIYSAMLSFLIVPGIIFLVRALTVNTQAESLTPFQKTQPGKPIYPVILGVVGLVILLIAFSLPDLGTLNYLDFLLFALGLLLLLLALIRLAGKFSRT